MKQFLKSISGTVARLFNSKGGVMGNKLYVGNLPYSTTEEQLADEFGQYGEVTDAKIIMDRDSGRSKGFAFITMGTTEAANTAVDQMNGRDMGGRQLKVSIAEDRPRQPRGNGGGGYQRDNRERNNDRGYSTSTSRYSVQDYNDMVPQSNEGRRERGDRRDRRNY